jgi:hypothetical protein
MASLELGVPIRPEMAFRIGSITKQLTAMAILRLVADGKLALDDEVGKLLPGYPSHGRRITVENLLTHTSGIPNYTDLPGWQKVWRERLSVPEIIDRFKDEPLDFPPGRELAVRQLGLRPPRRDPREGDRPALRGLDGRDPPAAVGDDGDRRRRPATAGSCGATRGTGWRSTTAS